MNNHGVHIARCGEINLRGYEIARVQFFNFAAVKSVTFTEKSIRFSAECIRNFGGAECVKLWLHPSKKSLVVKPCSQEDKQIIRWATVKNGVWYSREIGASAYSKTLYELFDWSLEYRYRFRGCFRQRNGANSIEFDLREPEKISKGEVLFPDDWDTGFGTDYYRYANLRRCIGHSENVSAYCFYNKEPDISPTAPEILNTSITDIIDSIMNPETNNGTEPDS